MKLKHKGRSKKCDKCGRRIDTKTTFEVWGDQLFLDAETKKPVLHDAERCAFLQSVFQVTP